MSYSLFNHSAGARRHKRSIVPTATGPGFSSFKEEQQEEFPDLSITRQSQKKKQKLLPPPPPSPNYSIVPSTIDLQGQSAELHLDTFNQFMDLPLEIRIKVYEFACLEPRVVPIWPVYTDRRYDEVEFRFASETPAIMQVCHEARKESQKLDIYAPTSDTPFPSPRIWIKPSIDIICPVRNGGALWTVYQFFRFSQIINHFKVERLGFDDFESRNYQLADNWHMFVVFPKWMNHNLRQILVYTSLNPINIRRQPLRLVNSNKLNLEQESEEFMMISMEADRRYEALEDMMGELNSFQRAQNKLDETTAERLVHIPDWLYEHRKTWTQPELMRCAAL